MKNAFDPFEEYPPFDGFPKQGIEFLKKLKRNNNRSWFERHKPEYESSVKFPMQCLLASLRPDFARIASEYEIHPKRSIFRVYRDTRFSKDKTPYKTHVAAHAVLRGQPKGFVGSGYYIHVEPGECFVGGGIYMPDSTQLKKIRKAVSAHATEFLGIVQRRTFVRRFGSIEGERLKRIPRGFDETDRTAEWLKLKQFFVGVSLPEASCYRPEFVSEVAAICESAAPLVRFLNAALSGGERLVQI
jgi:uncharacterized protein (TIGR02453 family)